MDELQEKKIEIRNDFKTMIGKISDKDLSKRTKLIENNLFELANFLESSIALLYMGKEGEVASNSILERCFELKKIVVLPAFNNEQYDMKLMKVDNLKTDLMLGKRGVLEPNINRCKIVPIESIDIAIIPGLAFDEKGGRVGTGEGYYDRFIPKLSNTTRKVALALDKQIIQQVPMDSHDKHVDIIVTDERIIYKI
ncbi:MAG: 5-formyltetrahydrofolate cyclo-ligase [Deltaproteobacteria bacterium]|nr:5-formyltetrahydrofolate cyclo-ligase [Deltaproteobacteria bacterium]MBW1813636.1 5-formyltetrahydrofolate cyclo-ligase [Deltaproteobacteria bacterium]MBW1846123.1 5-formyltetrahydrofolate cyclo-ligase [Deltaproteobacteria bacterium]MBW1984356.1 5-formyltetrahydrofolate cyclo-ligase [Deltaproteobacteria bacterium]MBW2180150.1 5-formyltetrahydrofolate cyclo-ligase [Deltaproteobacteria bacterium]